MATPVRSKHLRFDDALITRLRAMTVDDAVMMLDLYAKIDPDYTPNKDKQSKRLNISVGSSVFELIVTGEKWFDTRSNHGGGGAIDLTMHLFKEPFVTAVRRLHQADLIKNMSSDEGMEPSY